MRFGIIFTILLFPVVSASGVSVWQGQYYTGTTFNTGTYEFNFTVYDSAIGGAICFSNTTNLATGNWGEWKTEQTIGDSCTNASIDYWLEIRIAGTLQSDVNGDTRRRLTIWDYLRRDANDEIDQDLTVNGTILGKSPLRLTDIIHFINFTDETIFSIYHAHFGEDWSNVSADFDGSLIIQTDIIDNLNKMEVCFWDKENQKMFMCINEGAPARATTIRRSLQIVGNTSVKENDANFTLCEGNNYVDCATDVTGADLYVQDDIEAQSIYANENLLVVGNITGNNYYGGMKYNDGGFDLSLAVANQFTLIPNLSAGDLNGFTFSNNTLMSNVAGKYHTYLSGRYSDIKDNVLNFALFKNDVVDDDCFDIPSVTKAGKKEFFGFNCFVDLAVNDNLTLQVNATLNGTTTIHKVDLNLFRVGS
ncbi:MAG: hypothetical protein V3U02_00150 [Calditrichia bacterium]